MKTKEPKAMREIHKIREEHYLMTKDLSPKERVLETRRKAEEIIKKYNLKFLEMVVK